MKVKKFLKDKKGAVSIFVAIILGLFALGFIALVVDVGTLYVQRKAMITSADAAALAGAQVLRDSQGVKVDGADGAIAAAKNYAIANGAEESQVKVFVVKKSVTLPNGKTDNRQVIEVTVGKKQPLIFARFLGDEITNVKANAVATWGYVKESYIGNFIPIFTFDTDYKLNKKIYLHDDIPGTNSYGFIDIGSGMSDIKKAIAGNYVGGSYIYNNLLDGKPGDGEAVYKSVEERMKIAQKKATAEERRKTMIGLIPIIDKDEFLKIPGNDKKNSNGWKLPIKYFAYFEITDVIKQNGSVGSGEALDPVNEYKKVVSPFHYSEVDKKHPVLIVGKFTGEVVEARTIADVSDQINPNPSGDIPAAYSKLIK